MIAFCRSRRDEYQHGRLERIKLLEQQCQIIFECPFGSMKFIEEIKRNGPWDLLCHHGADVTNYKSADFDPVSALNTNSYQLRDVLKELSNQGCNRILLTGTVFEPGEGEGSEELRAVSPYGLSKGLTSQMFQYYCGINEMKLGKFVIPNPFGPYEETQALGRYSVLGRPPASDNARRCSKTLRSGFSDRSTLMSASGSLLRAGETLST